MKLSTRILAILLTLATCFSFLYEAVLAVEEPEAPSTPASVVETEAPDEPTPTDISEPTDTPEPTPETPATAETALPGAPDEAPGESSAPAEAEVPALTDEALPVIQESIEPANSGEASAPAETAAPTDTPEPTPTATPAPTPTATPTPTPTPTATPTPTPTASPTATPAPTATPNTDPTPIKNRGTAVKGTWKKSGGNWYYYVNGKAVKNGLYLIDKSTYYFNAKGIMQTGWVKAKYKTADGNSHTSWSYFSTSGVRKETGWVKSGGSWYYFKNGFTLSDCVFSISGVNYCFDANCVMQIGWVTTVTKDATGKKVKLYSYCDSSGARKEKGWFQYNSKWYYFKNGYAYTDCEKKISGSYYLFDAKGVMQTGWIKTTYTDGNGKTRTGKVYYSNSGRCDNGPYKIGNYWYYFQDSVMQTNGWIDGADGYRYHADASGHLKTSGWWQKNGYWYYFNYNGRMASGWKVIDGYTYYFYKGTEKNAGPTYSMAVSVKIDGTKIDAEGHAKMGVKERMLQEAQYYTSSTDFLIIIDHYYCKLGIFKQNSKGQWKYYKYIDCAPGKASTPTYTGVFSITSDRGYYFDSGAVRCFWYSTFNGAQAIHSVLYYPSGGLADSRVGLRLSHGCVRVAYSNAKWIYDNIPIGTTTVVI